jgi:hypothetical protein
MLKIVPSMNVSMDNVLNTPTIHETEAFVDVNQDGLDGLVLFHMSVNVHRIHYVLVLLLIIDRYVFVLSVDLVLDVFLRIQSVQRMEVKYARTVVNVFQMMKILNSINNLHVFARMDTLETDVK